ncbi:MAG TPA: outer membrane protein assembly factor BamD [Gemmatimonadales bacterium]|nr:outer membrane protein assembly factor BamD [Gemmatimonadales bacterium]
MKNLSRLALPIALAGLMGCHGHRATDGPAPKRLAPMAPDSLWNLAERAFNHGKWGAAQKQFDLLGPLLTTTDPRYLRMHFFLGEILFAQGNQLQAVREFRRVADERPEDPLAPEALLRAGDAYADLWRRAELDPTYGETARTVYQEVATRYPNTPAAARAGLRVTELAEKFAAKEYKSALFYFKFKADDSAILMFRGLIANYPRSKVVPGALEHLVRSYQRLGYAEDVKETCAYIAQYHPDPAGPLRLCPPTPAATPGGSGVPEQH